MSVTEFLLARIAEDEAVAQAAIDPSGLGSSPNGEWELAEYPYEGEWPRNPDAENVLWADSEWALHASRHDPARVLAECAAKRAIVALHEPVDYSGLGMKSPNACTICGADRGMHDWEWMEDSFPCPTIRTLAAVYADHDEYQDEWKVGA